ncbi:MAG: hypothetical protein H0X38_10610, partial [Planctomycetes bacterium]|nr:hypothetical protein [Planctomycetota bacterium]
MRKAWWFAGFAAGVAVIIAAVSWVTVTARALERSAAADRRQAFREESARLALWRMDSLLTPLIAREAARPYGVYSAFAPAERAYNRLFAPVKRGDVVLPSPLLGLEQPEVLLHFQVSPRGTLSSPQVPVGNQRALAEQGFVEHAGILRAEARLAQLGALVDRQRLMTALDHLASGVAEATRERSLTMCANVDMNKDDGVGVLAGATAATPVKSTATLPGATAPNAAVPAPVSAGRAAAAAPQSAPVASAPPPAADADAAHLRKAGPAEDALATNQAPPPTPGTAVPAPARRTDDQVGGQAVSATDRADATRPPSASKAKNPDRPTPDRDLKQLDLKQQQEQQQSLKDLPAPEVQAELTSSVGARSAKEQQARLKSYYNAADNREAPENKAANAAAPAAGQAAQPRVETTPVVSATPSASTTTVPAVHLQREFAAAPAPAAPPLPAEVDPAPGPATSLRAEIMRPLWLGDTLLLARRVTVDGTEHIQGCWLDWPRIRAQLLEGVKDLLPDAQLLPDANDGDDWRQRLATLPVRLEPGDGLPDYHDSPRAALTLTLVVAWVCVGLATLAGATLLLGALDLSERRGAFVSAVTHELRTPLTTFRLYADLLGGGMVPDERERQRCLDTLRSEADRLAHLVENVLAYARLERAQVIASEPVRVADLLHTACARLADRARQVGLDLVAERAGDALECA